MKLCYNEFKYCELTVLLIDFDGKIQLYRSFTVVYMFWTSFYKLQFKRLHRHVQQVQVQNTKRQTKTKETKQIWWPDMRQLLSCSIVIKFKIRVIVLFSGVCVCVSFMSVKYPTNTDVKKMCNTGLGHFQVYFCREPRTCPDVYQKKKNRSTFYIRTYKSKTSAIQKY